MMQRTIDEHWMRQALQQAQQAVLCGELPIGAVLVDQAGTLIASGYNQPVGTSDPTAHAEIMVLRAAGERVQNYRLPDTTLYVTLEPCAMCVGALVQARVARVVYGALEPRTGAIRSAWQLFESGKFNHTPEIRGGLLARECSALMSQFFLEKRQSKKSDR